MKKADKKSELLKKLQNELDIRTQAEEEAVRLISSGECEKACDLLKALDDSLVKEIERELDALEGCAACPKMDANRIETQTPVAEVCIGQIFGDFMLDVMSDMLAETVTVNEERIVKTCRAYAEGLSALKNL